MPDFEGLYGQHGSRFSTGMAADRRNSFSRYLGGDGGNLAALGGTMASRFQPPATSNALEQQALEDSTLGRNQQLFSQNVDRVNNQFGQYAQLGFNAVSQAQSVAQAKEMAQQQAASARQGAMFSAISSGINLLGGIGANQGWFSGGRGASLSPAAQAKSSVYGNRAFSSNSNVFSGGW